MSSNHQDDENEAEIRAKNLLTNIAAFKDKAKAKAQDILHIESKAQRAESDSDDVFSDPAFDPAKVLNEQPTVQHEASISEGFDDFKFLVSHPRTVMRSKATRVVTEKIGPSRHPIQAWNRDEELIEAHDTLNQAASNCESRSDADQEVVEASERIQVVESQRESLQTAWILGRHVSRVKVVRPVPKPEKSEFYSNQDGHSRFEWERYLGKMALYHTRGFTSHYIDDFESPPFDLEDLAQMIERLAIISAPWQTFCVRLRQVYTWSEPRYTAKCALVFWSLWYTEHIVGFFYLWIIYTTLYNKFHPTSFPEIRESVSRAFDREAKVQAWGELIQRHGKQDWLEPLLDDMGPMIQRQLGDLTDLLEVMVNFHRHERPKKTMASLFFFGVCLAITLLADMAFCVKLVWFITGTGFFFTFPIATKYPKYRLLVSNWRWMFWDIPTHAELAILQLQEKAVMRDADLMEFELDRADTETRQDIDRQAVIKPGQSYRFKIHHDIAGKGQLTVDRSGISLSSDDQDHTWPFHTLSEMRKVDDPDTDSSMHNIRRLGSRSGEILQFSFLSSPDLTVLLHTADRDRVFNLVLGWSELKWQSLQIQRERKRDGARGNVDTAIKRALH